MEMPRLLIADNSDEFRQILCDALSSTYSIQTCRDGKQALQLLRTFQPSLLLMDLALPELDGISLLQRAMEEGIEPAVLVVSSFQNAYIQSWLQRFDLSYLMPKPCDLTAIADRLADFSARLAPTPMVVADLHSAISDLLLHMGFAPNLDGFRFLQVGIPLYLQDPGQSMTKELYVAMGAPYHKSSKQVERSVRSAIDGAWLHGDQRLWRQYFGTAEGIVPRPCVSAFICRMAAAMADLGYGRKQA